MSELGGVLRGVRQERGWSLREVERRSGIANAHLTQIERGGISRPSSALLARLAAVYDLDVRELMRLAGYGDPTPSSAAWALRGAAYEILEELDEDGLEETLSLLDQVRRRGPRDPGD